MLPRKVESRSEPRPDNGQPIGPRNEQKLEIQRIEQYHQQQMQHLEQQKRQLQQQMFFEQQSAQEEESRNSTPSGRKMPLKTPTSMQRAATIKNQALQVCQNLRPTSRVYQSNADLYVSREKLIDPNQQLTQSQQNIFLQQQQQIQYQQNAQIQNQRLISQSHQHINVQHPNLASRGQTPLIMSKTNTPSVNTGQSSKHPLLRPTPLSQPTATIPQETQLQYKLRKRAEKTDL